MTFIRKADLPERRNLQGLPKLPWFSAEESADEEDTAKQMPFACSYCSKPFLQERSLKNHLKSKHGDDAHDKKRKRPDDSESQQFTCIHCTLTSVGLRSFDSSEALQDHIRAKHDAIHSTICPDWFQPTEKMVGRMALDPLAVGSCGICGHVFTTEHGEKAHIEALVPLEAGGSTKAVSLSCQFCAKKFRQTRAQLQHENFCPSRPVDGIIKVDDRI